MLQSNSGYYLLCAAYDFYRNMVISRTSTKEHIKKVANRQKVNGLENTIKIVEEKIQQFKTEKNDLPNITGKQVCHKKFDMGNVLQCENGRIKISFPVKEMTFQYLQAFVNGFLTCSDIDETIYQENREIEKTIDFQQKVIKNA